MSIPAPENQQLFSIIPMKGQDPAQFERVARVNSNVPVNQSHNQKLTLKKINAAKKQESNSQIHSARNVPKPVTKQPSSTKNAKNEQRNHSKGR